MGIGTAVRTRIVIVAILLGAAMAAPLVVAGCAATGGLPATAVKTLCAIHNSAEMKLLCETPKGN
jgi:outer membrane murein-binding lipoprotein Lpp